MMQLAIDRSRQTGGSFAASLGLHALALLLLAFLIGREVAQQLAGDELTEIAYIEARYGEDVAEKVKLKALKPAGTGGPGISTESAVKPEPAPTVAEVEAPEIEAPVAEPKLQPRQPLPAAPKLEPRRPEPKRPELAAADVPTTAPVVTPRKELAAAAQLEARTAPMPAQRVFDTEKLNKSLAGEVEDTELKTPRPARPTTRETFKPKAGGLRNRGGRAPVGSEPVVAATGTASRTRGKVAGADVALQGGGLSQRQAPASAPRSTRPALARGSAGVGGTAGAIVDVSGPESGSGGGTQKGRKTILDYGEGSGGGSGSLVGRRGRLAEPTVTRDIVESASGDQSTPAKQVAEADLDSGKGVGMTITGQIAGRKILSRVPAQYSDRARRNGWEGVVAVHFTVLPDGRVKDNMYFEQTSVHRDLNQAAMAALRQFRFAPLPASQSAVEQWGVITIVFRLN
ncbi:TonB family protein [bacterium]|nr:TonB family protein [bacterium]